MLLPHILPWRLGFSVLYAFTFPHCNEPRFHNRATEAARPISCYLCVPVLAVVVGYVCYRTFSHRGALRAACLVHQRKLRPALACAAKILFLSAPQARFAQVASLIRFYMSHALIAGVISSHGPESLAALIAGLEGRRSCCLLLISVLYTRTLVCWTLEHMLALLCCSSARINSQVL